MASNSLGTYFRITTFGESHGPMVGVVVDGCPAGLAIDVAQIDAALARRAPGRSPYTSLRKEPDRAQIVSGVFEGLSTGAPLTILVLNKDVDSSKYLSLRDLMRPGHAAFTYREKYGVYDHRGGGRASARETVARVAAGAVARVLLEQSGIRLLAYLQSVGEVVTRAHGSLAELTQRRNQSPLFCPDQDAEKYIENILNEVIAEGDSIGGVVEVRAEGVPVGLGDPVYEKMEAQLAGAMLSIPAARGFEIGAGFRAAGMRGSEHNDLFIHKNHVIATSTNRAGGVLGGITTGMPLVARVAFKPTSSIKKAQQTVDRTGKSVTLELPEGSRHDPCVAIRAVAVVEAMTALVLADRFLCAKAGAVGDFAHR